MLKCIIQIILLEPLATNTELVLRPCHTDRWCRSQKRSDQAFLLISTQTSKGRLECKWVAWCHCQIISTCTHMPSTHSAPLCHFNTGQMSEPQYQLFQMWISWESNNGKMWDGATAQIKELFSQFEPQYCYQPLGRNGIRACTPTVSMTHGWWFHSIKD